MKQGQAARRVASAFRRRAAGKIDQMARHLSWLPWAIAAAVIVGTPALSTAQKPTDADRAATLIVRWQQIIYPAFEDARASIDEKNSDHLNAVLSQGGVRAIQDRVDAAGLKKIEATVKQLAAALIKAAKRYPGGSLIIDSESFDAALDTVCPLYPFCQY
jgi:hypothetical protein